MISLRAALLTHSAIHLLLHLRQALNYILIGHIEMSAILYPVDMLVHYLVYLIPCYYLIFGSRQLARLVNIPLFAGITVLYLLLAYLGLDMVVDYNTENGFYPLSYFVTTLIHSHVLAMFAERLWVFIAYFGVAYSYMIFWTEVLGTPYAIFMEPNHFIELLVATGFSYLLYHEQSGQRKPFHFD